LEAYEIVWSVLSIEDLKEIFDNFVKKQYHERRGIKKRAS